MQSSSIDLVKNKSNLTDELIKWALTFGRLLIILVEIVAFGAFVYRFTLDRQLIDLNDKIEQSQAIIASSKERENTYRNLQERLAMIEEISTKGNINQKILSDILAITPPEITYNTLSIDNGRIEMDINVSAVSALSTFIKSLKEYPQVSSVSIVGIDNSSSSSSVVVKISVVLKGGVE
jgi:Tfp pilus assembly protein PilN